MKKRKQGRAYQPSGFYEKIKTDFSDFAEYITYCRTGVALTRLDLTAENRDIILNANCPSEIAVAGGTHKGILLLHGLYDSPCITQSLAQYFAERGFMVRSLLLPGHGTVPGDLLQITYEDWLAWGRFGLQTLQQEVEELYVVGFSMGAALASYLVLRKTQ